MAALEPAGSCRSGRMAGFWSDLTARSRAAWSSRHFSIEQIADGAETGILGKRMHEPIFEVFVDQDEGLGGEDCCEK
jgi:hypothetical protein